MHRVVPRAFSRALVGLGLVALVGLMISAAPIGAASSSEIYIVQMVQNPAVAYTGGVQGLAATKPGKGQKLDPDSAKVIAYTDYLKSQHDKALSGVGGGKKLYDYGITYNGFAAELTDVQAEAIEKQSGVLTVTPSELVEVDTSSTPAFLGLTAPGGLWAQLGGPTGGKKGVGAGENIVIGVIDSGIWPESKSFSDRNASGELTYQPMSGSKWHGNTCRPGEAWEADRCNKKLLTARHFNEAWGGDAGVEAVRPWEFQSPRDYNGHGTHTAGTSGGNNGVPATGPAAVFGTVSGIAPRARIAAYKALWSTQDGSTASGQTADLVAAIDQAVADGVDVINYSVSGTTSNFLDPVEIAYLFAADAGIFVSQSAGNSGPTTGTVAHPSPWTTTVAAGTHNRNGIGSVTLGNSATYTGASVASAVGPAPFIDSTAAGLPGADPAKVALCYSANDNAGVPVLDPTLVNGKIVLCDRGVTARVNKSLAVEQAGGVGMVLVNTSASSLNADFHFVPTVHLSHTDRPAVKAYAATSGATAKINQSTITYSDPAPFTASFSSRGPLTAGGGDLLKPDVIAPGQDILAAVAPPGNAGRDFNLLSGTSMSAPHVAGLGALLKQKFPTWTPTAIKSALMTSAYDVLDGPNANPLVIFRQGAGHVRPNNAANPGLVFDSNFNDWLAFLCGTTTGVNPASCAALVGAGYSLDASDLNVASIAIGDLAGSQTVKRRVTNVGSSSATYTPSVTGMSGVTTVVTPSSLTLAPGQTATFNVAFTRTSAALNSYSTASSGQLTWTDGTRNVRIPIVTRPVPLAVPADVSSDGSSVNWTAKTGYNGSLNAVVGGLYAATTTPFSVTQDPDQTFAQGDPTGTYSQNVVVGPNEILRAGIYETDITPTGTDLDMFVYNGTTFVGQSADGDSNEQVTVRNSTAAPITYTVYVHGWSTNGPSASGTLFTWALPLTDAGNTTISGVNPATIGGTQTHTASFAGLNPDTRYFGRVDYNDGSSVVGRTLLTVTTP